MSQQYQIKLFLFYFCLFYCAFFKTLITADSIKCSEIFGLEFDDLNRIKSGRLEFLLEKKAILNGSYIEVWFAFNEVPM